MAIDIENVTVSSADEFNSNNLYKDGYPVAASYLNPPLSTLKKELNHINFIVNQLINKDGVELFVPGKMYGKDKVVRTSDMKYYISVVQDAYTNDLATSQSFRELKIPGTAASDSKIAFDIAFHAVNAVYDSPVLNALEQQWVSYTSNIEYNAEILRMLGASGIFSTRQYTYDVPFDPKERIFGVTYNAMGQHNHPDYRGMPGTAELSVVANGYYVRTRHNDYQMFAPVQGSYLARKEILPPTPTNSPATIGAATDAPGANTQYGYMKEIYTRQPQDCVFFLTYLECWFEDFTGGTGDYTDSFRHSTDATNMKDMIEQAIYLNAGGHKNRLENIPFTPLIVRRVTAKGEPTLAALRYRVSSFPVGTLSSSVINKTMVYSDGTSFTAPMSALPFNETKSALGTLDATNVFALRKDLRQAMRFKTDWGNTDREWVDLVRSGLATFDLTPGKLLELCERVPGMMGQGATITETYKQYGLNDTLTVDGGTATLNAAYYNHNYSMLTDASGRDSAHRGFNDPNLFVAKTDDTQVIDGFSYMVPLELVLRTPREGWNPYGAVSTPDPTLGGTRSGLTAASPLEGWWYNKYNFTLPADMFAGTPSSGTDAADTYSSAYVSTPSGVKYMKGSGINLFDYNESTVAGHRKRFAIFAEFQDYSKPGSDLELYKKAMKVILKKIRAGTATDADIDNLYTGV